MEETIEAAQRKAAFDDPDEDGTFAGRTISRVRKFATAIKDRSMGVVWPSYQDRPNDDDVETRRQSRSNTLASKDGDRENSNISHKISTFSEPDDGGFRSRKRTIVDNILQNRLFGSGAAKLEVDEPSDEVVWRSHGCS